MHKFCPASFIILVPHQQALWKAEITSCIMKVAFGTPPSPAPRLQVKHSSNRRTGVP